MVLGQIFGIILISCGAVTLFLAGRSLWIGYRVYRGNFYLSLLCLASAVWSYGFAIVFLTDDVKVAYYGRAVGMCGVIPVLLLAQFMFVTISHFPKGVSHYLAGFSLLGIPVLVFCISPNAATFYMSDWGMSYSLNPGFYNSLYMAFSVVYGLNIAASIVILFARSKTRREKKTAQIMLVALVIIFAGMILDTIIPLAGYPAIPGSSITQSLGAWVIYIALTEKRKTHINIENMSEYAYYAITEPMLVFDDKGILRLANTAADELFNNLRSKITTSVIHVDDIFVVASDYFNYRGKHRKDECITVRENVNVLIDTNRIYDSYKDTVGYIITVQDITETKAMLESLEEAKKLTEAHNAAKSTFLANMSHEIRTPMNSIIGLAELLLKADDLGPHKESIMDIRNASNNLLAIINDVLDISKIESGRMELVESRYRTVDVLQDAYFAVENQAREKNLDFTMECDSDAPCSLYGDSVRLRGVLVNLLNNAIKYTNEGSVKLSGSIDSKDGTNIVMKYEISDSGIGIKPEDMDKLFKTFSRVDQRTNADVEGTGLGLAIVKGYVDLLGGTIEVSSIYGKGSTFTIKIPGRIIDDTPIGKFALGIKSSRVLAGMGSVKFPGLKVLAVDDNRVNLKVISKCLEAYGMDVMTSEDGGGAVEKCRYHEFDLILMDQMMPSIDGVEAMNRIRKINDYYGPGGKCKIVVLTANAVAGSKEQLVAAGFDDYLSKPIVFSELENLLTGYFK